MLSPARAEQKRAQLSATLPLRACSSVEERRPSKPLVGGSNPPRRIPPDLVAPPMGLLSGGAYVSPPQPTCAAAARNRLVEGGSPEGRHGREAAGLSAVST